MVAVLASLIFLPVVIVLPLGVAGQHIGLGVALAVFIYGCVLDRGVALRSAFHDPRIRTFLMLWVLIMLPILISTLAAGRTKDATRFFWGYIYGACLPVVGRALSQQMVSRGARTFLEVYLWLCGIVAVTQIMWAWKFESGKITATIARAQGFYSHPLTFAYVSLIVMPWAYARAAASPSLLHLTTATAVTAMVLCSQSVTIIAISCVLALLSVVCLADRRIKAVALVGLVAGIAVVSLTENKVSNKVKTVLSGERGDDETAYPDDRMAFWHAHWEMFKDAPVLGHGAGLEKEDRAPYYQRIGLGDIKRMYEAHNMYLQYAVEGGLIPTLALLSLLIWLAVLGWATTGAAWERFYLAFTPISLALGGMTQNAIQDSEVRFAFLAFVAVLFWLPTSRLVSK